MEQVHEYHQSVIAEELHKPNSTFCSICNPSGIIDFTIDEEITKVHMCSNCKVKHFKICTKCKAKKSVYDFQVLKDIKYPVYYFDCVCEDCTKRGKRSLQTQHNS